MNMTFLDNVKLFETREMHTSISFSGSGSRVHSHPVVCFLPHMVEVVAAKALDVDDK